MVLSGRETQALTGGRETTANDLARRVVLVALGMTFFALAALMWPSQASAQIEACSSTNPDGCRPLCIEGYDPGYGNMPESTTPSYTLTTASSGGTGTFHVTAWNSWQGEFYNPVKGSQECASDNGGGTWKVKRKCTFHCEHRHFWITDTSTGIVVGMPQPSLARITATPDSGFHLGWTVESGCVPPTDISVPRDRCAQIKMEQDRTVTALFGVTDDSVAPTLATFERTSVQRNRVTFTITDPSEDETWLGGYDVAVNGVLRTRVRADAPTFTVANLLCKTQYTFQLRAFDAANETSSNIVNATTSACPKVPPNGYFHVKPPRRTKQKSAFFHWGAKRGGVELGPRAFKSRCKVDKRRWTKCSAVNGKTVRKLKPGWHTFRVKVGDAQGWDRTPAICRWQVRR